MFIYQLKYEIEEGQMNRFLIGSRTLFDLLESYITVLLKTVDVKAKTKHKLVELESRRITYQLELEIEYTKQYLLGTHPDNSKIDSWIESGLNTLFSDFTPENSIKMLKESVDSLKLNQSILYVELPEKYLLNLLEDLQKLSILLFNKLVFFEKKG